MKKLTKLQIENKNEIISNKNLSIEERRAAYNDILQMTLNPVENFDPETFDPFSDDPDYEVKRRPRQKHSGKINTFGMNPKKILEGQMIGHFESKQDLYLLFANKFNDLMDEVEDMKKEIKKLQKQ